MSFPQMTEQFSYCVSRRDLSTIKRQKSVKLFIFKYNVLTSSSFKMLFLCDLYHLSQASYKTLMPTIGS